MSQGFSKSPIAIPTRQHNFDLDLANTALLVIDMQYDFCDRDGFCSAILGANIQPMQTIVPRLQRLLAWARASGLLIVYTRESHAPDLSDLSPSKRSRYENAGYPVGSLGKLGRFLVRGDAGTAILQELAPQPQDWQIDKPAQSVFVGTDLEQKLRDRGITHLLITGVTTACCVLASYRQASDLGFYGLLLEDCCAAFRPEEHQAAIEVLLGENGAIGWVTTSEQLMNTVRVDK